MTRVLVTGLGVVCGTGVGVGPFWAAVREGRSAVRRLPALRGLSYDLGPVAAVPDEAAPDGAALLGGESRAAPLLCVAGLEALRQGGLEPGALAPERLGVTCGTTMGGKELWLAALRDAHHRGLALPPAPLAEDFSNGGPARALARQVGAGRVRVLSTACASGNAALGSALDLLRSGACAAVLAGGVDVVHGYVLAGFGCLRAYANEPCRPFDRRRKGLNLGEGAAVLLLETEEHARGRGARALAELRGYGLSSDAVHMTGPDREGRGAARAMRAALADGGLPPEAVDFLSLHGTATVYNDQMEARAVRAVFGEREVPVNSIKGVVGHTLGASGALEAVMGVRCLQEQQVPPTCGFEEPDPLVPLRVPVSVEAAVLRCVLSTSSGFGGINAAVVLSQVTS